MTRQVAVPLQLSLQFADARHRAQLPRHRVLRWMRAALAAPGQFTVRVVDADEGRALNRDWRGKDHATNVLTFSYDDPLGASPRPPEGAPGSAGGAGPSRDPRVVIADLVLCAPVVEREAQAEGKALDAHYAHLLVHGVLHAQGWDHERAADARRMEAHESALLQALGFADPYGR